MAGHRARADPDRGPHGVAQAEAGGQAGRNGTECRITRACRVAPGDGWRREDLVAEGEPLRAALFPHRAAVERREPADFLPARREGCKPRHQRAQRRKAGQVLQRDEQQEEPELEALDRVGTGNLEQVFALEAPKDGPLQLDKVVRDEQRQQRVIAAGRERARGQAGNAKVRRMVRGASAGG